MNFNDVDRAFREISLRLVKDGSGSILLSHKEATVLVRYIKELEKILTQKTGVEIRDGRREDDISRICKEQDK